MQVNTCSYTLLAPLDLLGASFCSAWCITAPADVESIRVLGFKLQLPCERCKGCMPGQRARSQ